ncbi:Retrovirus-related Pol polyprotein from transposon 17.6, partial [Dictyocoela muelleri]
SNIFNKINKQPLLSFPDLNKHFELFCDASDSGTGAVISQDKRIIGFLSSTYKGAEINYTIAEKEMLAILRAFQKFKYLLFNTKTIVYTDNKNIISPGCLTKRMNRWKLMLQEFDHEIKHIEGKKNVEADMLSRTRLFKISDFKENYQNQILLNAPPSLMKTNSPKSKDATISKEEIIKFFEDIHIRLIHPGANKMFMT